MTTLVKKPNNGYKLSSHRSNDSSLSSWVDNFLENSVTSGFLSNFNNGMTLPAVNIKETKDQFILELAIPGMKKSDFNIDVDNKVLSISSEIETKNEESDEQFTRREFGYSSFKRTFSLPDSVNSDQIQASYTDGILKIDLPKREEAKEKPARRVEIG